MQQRNLNKSLNRLFNKGTSVAVFSLRLKQRLVMVGKNEEALTARGKLHGRMQVENNQYIILEGLKSAVQANGI